MPVGPFLSQAPVSGYMRMHYFKKNLPFKELVHTSWQENIYDKQAVKREPSLVEEELRREAMECIQDMNEKMIVANRLTKKDGFLSQVAFGGEGQPPRDLWWVDNVYKYLELSFLPKPSLLAEFGEPPKAEAEVDVLWRQDLWEAFDRLDCLLHSSVGIDVAKSFFFKPWTGLVDKIVPYYFNPIHGLTQKRPSLIAVREFHVAILKVYYALLAMAHSICHKLKNTSPLGGPPKVVD